MSAETEKARSFVVIGLGGFGGTVAGELARFGNRVMGVDTDEKRVSRYADDLSEAIIADGRDEQALRDAGVAAYDAAVVAIGEHLEASIVCTMNMKLLGVKTVWVKALNRTHHRILNKLGADRVILPEQEIGQHVAQRLHNPLVRDYMSLGNGFIVVSITAPEDLTGAALSSLRLRDRFDLRCLGVMRKSQFIDCGEDVDPVMEEGDTLLLLGRRAELRAFADSL
jgi:trk system potassium uptake protein